MFQLVYAGLYNCTCVLIIFLRALNALINIAIFNENNFFRLAETRLLLYSPFEYIIRINAASWVRLLFEGGIYTRAVFNRINTVQVTKTVFSSTVYTT